MNSILSNFSVASDSTATSTAMSDVSSFPIPTHMLSDKCICYLKAEIFTLCKRKGQIFHSVKVLPPSKLSNKRNVYLMILSTPKQPVIQKEEFFSILHIDPPNLHDKDLYIPSADHNYSHNSKLAALICNCAPVKSDKLTNKVFNCFWQYALLFVISEEFLAVAPKIWHFCAKVWSFILYVYVLGLIHQTRNSK